MDSNLIPCKENGMPWACPRWQCLMYNDCDWSDHSMLICNVKCVPIDRRNVMSQSEYNDYLVNQID